MFTLTEAKIKAATIDCRHFIDGEFVDFIDNRMFDNVNPVTEEVMGKVAEGGKEEIDLAVAAAKRALTGPWKTIPADERATMLRRIGDLILERQEELATLESLDTGKPYTLANTLDIPRAANNFYFFADYIRTMGNESYQTDNTALNYSIRRPIGVVGIISPWNLPLLLLTWKLAPCLAAGNTAVLKPAEWTPMTATVLGEICQEAGLPEGVVNIVHGFGPNSAGAALSEHPDVNAITFTGETTTGKTIMKAAANTLKRLSFELGGKNPNIIFADANLDEVVETTIRSSFSNQGEVCLCGSRVYVERPIFDEFIARFVAETERLVVGDPFAKETDVGPLISKEHYDRVRRYVELAKAEGGTVITGGRPPTGLTRGCFLKPTIITGLHDQCRVVQEEIFGPVVTVMSFDTEEEVVARANATHYGLSATIWTNDLRRAHRVAGRIEAGIIWVNTWFLRDLRTPFGGMKQSGIGREGGMHSIDFYSEVSNVCIKL